MHISWNKKPDEQAKHYDKKHKRKIDDIEFFLAFFVFSIKPE